MSAGVLNEVVDAAKGLFFLIDLLQKLLNLSSKPDEKVTGMKRRRTLLRIVWAFGRLWKVI